MQWSPFHESSVASPQSTGSLLCDNPSKSCHKFQVVSFPTSDSSPVTKYIPSCAHHFEILHNNPETNSFCSELHLSLSLVMLSSVIVGVGSMGSFWEPNKTHEGIRMTYLHKLMQATSWPWPVCFRPGQVCLLPYRMLVCVLTRPPECWLPSVPLTQSL